MRKLILPLIVLACAGGSTSVRAEIVQGVTIVYTDNSVPDWGIPTADISKIEVSGENVNIVKKTGASTAIAKSAIDRIKIGDIDESGVANVKTDNALIVKVEDSYVKLVGAPADETALLYSMEGKLILSEMVDADGVATFNVAGLPTGVYIIKVKNFSRKIVKQ